MAVDYREIGGAIVQHLKNKMSGDLHITQSIADALGKRNESISILVTFDGLARQETASQSPATPARDANYKLRFVARADSIDGQDKLLDKTVSEVEEHLNPNADADKGHGYPIFGVRPCRIGRSMVMRVSPKTIDDRLGLNCSATLTLRIREDI